MPRHSKGKRGKEGRERARKRSHAKRGANDVPEQVVTQQADISAGQRRATAMSKVSRCRCAPFFVIRCPRMRREVHRMASHTIHHTPVPVWPQGRATACTELRKSCMTITLNMMPLEGMVPQNATTCIISQSLGAWEGSLHPGRVECSTCTLML